MGVSGAGKSTVAAALAAALGGAFLDADDLHPPANIAKMASGTPLDDDDRMPWLAAVGRAGVAASTPEAPAVVACSALAVRYRDALRTADPACFFVHLDTHVIDHIDDIFNLLGIDDVVWQVVVYLRIGQEALLLALCDQVFQLRLLILIHCGFCSHFTSSRKLIRPVPLVFRGLTNVNPTGPF